MKSETKYEIKECLCTFYKIKVGDFMGWLPGTHGQRKYWLRKGWVEKDNEGRHFLTAKGYSELKKDKNEKENKKS